jgi:hypothetical protein
LTAFAAVAFNGIWRRPIIPFDLLNLLRESNPRRRMSRTKSVFPRT